MTESSSFSNGLAIRRRVMGDARVDQAFDGTDEIALPLQELVTSFAWGEVWSRPDLDLRSRSILTIGILISQGRVAELKAHLIGGINNGLKKSELVEIVIQSAVYCGFPAALEASRVLREITQND